MKPQKTVTVIGGGIAGLSAAVFLTERNFKVILHEATPKFGGRAYSFFDKEKNRFFDNGQHLLAGWYKNTFDYLKIIGSFDKLNFQKGLEVNFVNTEKRVFKLKCPDLAPPMNLLVGLMKFNAFGLKDKYCLKNINKLIRNADEFENEFGNVSQLLDELKQTPNVIKYFWEPFVLAVFNTQLENVSAKVFLRVMRLGFNEKTNSTLVIPDVNLNELLIDDVIKYCNERDVKIQMNSRVVKVSAGKEVDCIFTEDGSKIVSDYYISAVPFFGFKKMFEDRVYYDNGFRSESLRASSIVSVHLFMERDIPDDVLPDNSLGMTGLIGTITQWIFKKDKRHLSLVISGADYLQVTEMSSEEIYDLCLKDLNITIDGFDSVKIRDYKVIKEKRATFIPDIEGNEFRPSQKTGYRNFFIAGDWTDTGMPATIESAVTSAKICCELITDLEFGISNLESKN